VESKPGEGSIFVVHLPLDGGRPELGVSEAAKSVPPQETAVQGSADDAWEDATSG
jgi:hypothetical protein